MITERVETLIIGGGQAGLTISHMLSRRGCPHLVLERGRIAERWRSERWDGLRFQFPNWSVKLPDCPFPYDEPRRVRNQLRDRCLPRGLCAASEPADPLRCRRHGVGTQRGRDWHTRPDLLGLDCVTQRRDRHRTISATRGSSPTCRRLRPVPGPCQCVQRPRAASLRSRPDRRLGRVWGPDCRGALACRQKSVSVCGAPQTHAAPVPRTRSDLVAGGDGARSNTRRETRNRCDLASHHGRLWRTYHRFSSFRSTGDHLAWPTAVRPRTDPRVRRRSQ